MRRFPLPLLAVYLLTFICLMVFFFPQVWPYEAGAVDPLSRNQPPSLHHPFGTDQLGRDLLARVLQGGQVSLTVGFAAMTLSLGLGALVGLSAGMVRWLDGPLMRLTDLFLALPLLPLLLVMVMLFRESLSDFLGSQTGMFLLITGAISLTSWMPIARVIRGEVLSLRQRDFILAATAMGLTARAVITRHLLPNLASPLAVAASLGVANAILTESALSFLGLGLPPDIPSWGRLLQEGAIYLDTYPERALMPGLMLTLTLLAVHLLADGLRDRLDPRHA